MRKNGVNILVTGTPGVGKTTLCRRIIDDCKLKYLNIAELIKDKNLYSEWDDEMDCNIYDEDKLNNELQRMCLEEGGFLIDFHSTEGIDEDDIDHAVVLTTDIEILCGRLKKRGYNDKKIDNNIEAEIFKVCLEDALDAYGEEKTLRRQKST
ncbi:p-loop containing nucleoside triphosphate hydrolase like protein [Babesia gibsoni]|uniref:P-loop containing nucleoside triphosphate hydrolase like protein n=1 Tax=Babesia gibsoni TaxID=33632 RepID=A0AAD8PEF8_BABGI|nr:p-loop containing nucleoside triphosphate hydrolase like protein [Babesia gibsoni]